MLNNKSFSTKLQYREERNMHKLLALVVLALCYGPQVEGKGNVEEISVNEKHIQAVLMEIKAMKSEMKILKEENSNIKEENQVIKSRLNELETKPGNQHSRSGPFQDNYIGFSAYIVSYRTYQSGETVLFDGVLRNYGDGYDSVDGEFTSPVNGLYLFYFAILAGYEETMSAHLYLDDEMLLGAHASGDGTDTSGNVVIIHVTAGQRVRVVCANNNADLGGVGNRETSFSGVLLQLE